MARAGRVLFDIPPQPNDEIVDGAGVGVLVNVPDTFEDGFAADGAAFVGDQIAKEFRFHLGKRDSFAFGR